MDERLQQPRQVRVAVNDIVLDLDPARLVAYGKHTDAIRASRNELLEVGLARQCSRQIVRLANRQRSVARRLRIGSVFEGALGEEVYAGNGLELRGNRQYLKPIVFPGMTSEGHHRDRRLAGFVFCDQSNSSMEYDCPAATV